MRAEGSAGPARAFDTRPAFWVAMFMASAFGANLGDYVADLGARTISFVVMTIICLAAIVGDRRAGLRTEGYYWVAIIALRAAATNLADFITHDLKVSYPLSALALGVLTLAAGWSTQLPGSPASDRGSPLIDGRYWLAMFLAGLFGTVAGDFTSHTVGLFAATTALVPLLAVVLAVRARFASVMLLAYWIAVMAERTAATPFADLLDSHHGLGLGLPVAMVITLSLFLLALQLRRRSTVASPRDVAA